MTEAFVPTAVASVTQPSSVFLEIQEHLRNSGIPEDSKSMHTMVDWESLVFYLEQVRDRNLVACAAMIRGFMDSSVGFPTSTSYYLEWKTITIGGLRQTGRTLWSNYRFGDDTVIVVANREMQEMDENHLHIIGKKKCMPGAPRFLTARDVDNIRRSEATRDAIKNVMKGIKNVVVSDSMHTLQRIPLDDLIQNFVRNASCDLNFYLIG